ncbi:PepSY domain-containing protein [Comamonas piscis]|uniref:PepSY domain-containing protein n=1 Tax=Comamonas piscis TaxID=1562974 RepID=A0A7G5EM57_9BURK|nr:PepSY-associated TM helix domain-containing protein [Comamonas piscis]QMV75082.1 PepSY domain-containing protein [Comamonas piscis]WSO33566.1 PepSY-associated TM helix domain-containing protein [Comamonas piscis]
MKNGFRQSMAWLHTWCGLLCGWLLCAIMLTGTLSVFREPITRWMQDRPSVEAAQAPAQDGLHALDHALGQAMRHLAEQAPQARFWRIELPAQPGDAMRLVWRSGSSNHLASLHPATGALLPGDQGRTTEGGRHFMTFHYLLHAGMPGYWLVGWVSMCMLIGLVSGVVVHRRIFQDFFTFRPGKGQRSWLDAHNATAVYTLPFLLMIVYTGLFIFYTSYMPWPMRAAYGTQASAYQRFQAELLHQAAEPADRPRTGIAANLVPLGPLLQQAQTLLGQPARIMVVEQPGDLHMTVRVIGRVDEDSQAAQGIHHPAGSVAFDGVTGAVLQIQHPSQHARSATEQVHGVMESLHYARFGGWPMRWLYFFSGLLGTLMVATGTVLFSVKRLQKSAQEFGQATPAVYRAIEAMNVASVAGIAVACIAFFYANRLLPVELPGRAQWEIRCFLWLWLASLVHAALRPPRLAWVEQLATAAALCLLLPLLNLLTTGQFGLHYALQGDGQRSSVEAVAIGLGLLLAAAAWRTQRSSRASGSPLRPRPATRTASPAP